MISNIEIVTKFIKENKAFDIMPKQFLDLTKKNLTSGEWKVYRFDARVIDDDGWEIDADHIKDETIHTDSIKDKTIHATYCWTGNNEYCITSPQYLQQVKTTYNSDCVCIFSI